MAPSILNRFIHHAHYSYWYRGFVTEQRRIIDLQEWFLKLKRIAEGWSHIIKLTAAPVVMVYWHVKSVFKSAVRVFKIPRWRAGRWGAKT